MSDAGFEPTEVANPRVQTVSGAGAPTSIRGPAIVSASTACIVFLLSPESQRKAARAGVLPVVHGAEGALQDRNLKRVHEALKSATGFQLYLDQAYPPAIGQQVNDSVAALVARSASPRAVAQAIAKTAKNL